MTALPTVVGRYLSDLRSVLNTDVYAARALLARLVGSIILRRDGPRLLAEMTWNLEGLLGGDNAVAGRGISYLPQWPPLALAVA